MKTKKIILISLSLLGALLAAALSAFLVYTAPRKVELMPLEKNGVINIGDYEFLFNEKNGSFSLAKNESTLFANAYCEYIIDGEKITSRDYTTYSISESKDGSETKILVTMAKSGLPELTQQFSFFDNKNYFLTDVTISDENGVKSNYIAPLVIENGQLQNSAYEWKSFLEVPSDNDQWAEFTTKKLWQNGTSYEVGALFCPDEGAGLILGSVTHDSWKTAVTTRGGFGKVNELRIFCGASDPKTGAQEHGAISDKAVSSARVMIGFYDNWKDGMNEFSAVNVEHEPKRAAVTDGVPFGWNSWGSVQDTLTYDTAIASSDYIKEHLQAAWQDDSTVVYVNLDSWWDMLSDEQLKDFVDKCHQNGQKAGIYSAPFITWHNEEGMKNAYVPGTDDKVTYHDIRLKKADGSYYTNEVDGCYALDVTNPSTKKHVEHQFEKFKNAGFDYIKLDFLVHASFEGDYYDKSIQTGIQAYNYAMSYLMDLIPDNVFVNLAMSPTFPYQYANGRRLACDAFYSIGETEYTLNSVTYGFWQQGLYDYTDPDHLVVWGKDGNAKAAEAKSRITLGAIAGTSYLTGDNYVAPTGDKTAANERFQALLVNKDIVRVAKIGKIFNPLIEENCPRSANIYTLEHDGKLYVAFFNFSKKTREFKYELPPGEYKAKELWSADTSNVSGEMSVKLKGCDSALFELVE